MTCTHCMLKIMELTKILPISSCGALGCNEIDSYLLISSKPVNKILLGTYFNRADSKCCFCTKVEETIHALISGCFTVASNEFKYRHNRVWNYLH